MEIKKTALSLSAGKRGIYTVLYFLDSNLFDTIYNFIIIPHDFVRKEKYFSN